MLVSDKHVKATTLNVMSNRQTTPYKTLPICLDLFRYPMLFGFQEI